MLTFLYRGVKERNHSGEGNAASLMPTVAVPLMAGDAWQLPGIVASLLLMNLLNCAPAEFASEDFSRESECCRTPACRFLHPGAIPASPAGRWVREQVPSCQVPGSGERERSIGGKQRREAATGRDSGRALAQPRMLWGHPVAPRFTSGGKAMPPRSTGSAGVSAGVQHDGLRWGGRRRGWALHRGNRPSTQRAGEQSCRPRWLEAPSTPVASDACGDLPVRRERKREKRCGFPASFWK